MVKKKLLCLGLVVSILGSSAISFPVDVIAENSGSIETTKDAQENNVFVTHNIDSNTDMLWTMEEGYEVIDLIEPMPPKIDLNNLISDIPANMSGCNI